MNAVATLTLASTGCCSEEWPLCVTHGYPGWSCLNFETPFPLKAATFALCIVCSLAVSWVLTHCVERPLTSALTKAITSKSRAAEPAPGPLL